jgi:hypothetical protein
MENIETSVAKALEEVSLATAHEMVTDAAVRWNLAWANDPVLEFLIANTGQPDYRMPAPFTEAGVYHSFPI